MDNNDILDFSQESDLKPRLWNMMQQKQKEAAPTRKEVSFDSLGGGSQTHKSKTVGEKPPSAAKKRDKSK